MEFEFKVFTVFLLEIGSQLLRKSGCENGGAFDNCAALFDLQTNKATKGGNDAQIAARLGFSEALDDALDAAAMQAAIAVHACFEKLAGGSVGVFADFHRGSKAEGKMKLEGNLRRRLTADAFLIVTV